MDTSSEPLFFSAEQWETVEAAAARIIPTDRDPGAREAGVVHFIDRYLSGIDYVYANPWGSGFLRLEGKQAEAWSTRIARQQERYRDGLRQLDELSREAFGRDFRVLDTVQQDQILVDLSGRPKPRSVVLDGGPAETDLTQSTEGVVLSQPVTDEELDFFGTLVLHTRMGFYGDAAYGGNRDQLGWRTIGFPGPASLADTHGRFSTMEYMEEFDYSQQTASHQE
jgi:gluconate 2-dehydrogenase gamma chain